VDAQAPLPAVRPAILPPLLQLEGAAAAGLGHRSGGQGGGTPGAWRGRDRPAQAAEGVRQVLRAAAAHAAVPHSDQLEGDAAARLLGGDPDAGDSNPHPKALTLKPSPSPSPLP